jgi:two-component system heavy metal sensor histidine kinase CusS
MSSKPDGEPVAATRWSLAARLTAWYAGSAFLLVAAVAAFLYAVLVANLEREDEQLLADEFQSVRALLGNSERLARLRQRLESETTTRQHFQFLVRVLDPAGSAVVESARMAELLSPDLIREHTRAQDTAELETASGRSFHVLARMVSVGQPPQDREVQIAMDRTFEEDLLAGYRRGLAVGLGVALLLCTVIGYQIVRRGLRPLRQMAETARHIRSTTLHERLATAGLPPELAVLAAKFNDMLDRLEEAFSRLSRFSADIAHELRTPVNNLRGEVEVALGRARSPAEYRETLGSCLEECGRLSRMIDSLLFLARAEGASVPATADTMEVRRELELVRDFYEPAAGEAGICLSVQANGSLFARVDRTLFQRAVGNLVSNAIAHTTAGGQILMTAAAENGQVRIEVRDTGGGIPTEHLPHVFDRFYRADKSRAATSGGMGLGLAIVHTIATMHGGSAAIKSEIGKGTVVSLTFPVTEAIRPKDMSG